MFHYFTDIVKRGVTDRKGYWVGHPFDFTFAVDEAYPSLKAIVIAKGWRRRRFGIIPWSQVARINDTIQLNSHIAGLEFVDHYYSPDEFTLKKDLLDKQVVDTFNRKLVRVNDVHLMQVGNQYRLVHVDVSLRGLIRRLNWEKTVDAIIGKILPHALYLKREGLISWKFIQTLSIHPIKGTIQLNVSMDEMQKIPPPDLSQMLVEMDSYQRMALYRSLSLESQVDSLKEMDMSLQVELISCLETKRAIAVVENMPSDDAVDLLHEMRRIDVDRLLSHMNTKKAKKLSTLIAHESDSAGGLMTTEMVMVPSQLTIRETIERIKATEKQKETIYYVYVTDEQNRLEGVATFRELLVADPEQKIGEIMVKKPVSVYLDASAKEIAYLIDKYRFLAIPVVDHEGVLQGIISFDDILSLVMTKAWG